MTAVGAYALSAATTGVLLTRNTGVGCSAAAVSSTGSQITLLLVSMQEKQLQQVQDIQFWVHMQLDL